MVCDVELLLASSQLTYRTFKREGRVIINEDIAYQQTPEHERASFFKASPIIEDKGYSVISSVRKPSGLNALCLAPTDPESPIVIAYRGTKDMSDVIADLSIAKDGVTPRALRRDAYELYLDMKQKYPGRDIVLTGHSLGGHLAQDVGLKAHLYGEQGVQVRTFNTAPADTLEGRTLEATRPKALDNFVNYRLSSDTVSDIPFYKGYGDFYSFASGKSRWQVKSSHVLSTMNEQLPKDIKNSQVGRHSESQLTSEEARLIERIQCMNKAYEARVSGQIFSRYRTGSKNLEVFQSQLPDIAEAIKNKDHMGAKRLVSELRHAVGGTESSKLVAILERDLDNLDKQPKPPIKQALFAELKERYGETVERGRAQGGGSDDPKNTPDSTLMNT